MKVKISSIYYLVNGSEISYLILQSPSQARPVFLTIIPLCLTAVLPLCYLKTAAAFIAFYLVQLQNHRESAILPIDDFLDQAIRDIFTTSSSVDELLPALEKLLIASVRFQYPEELALTIKTIIQMEGILTSTELSSQVFYSSRHLNRLFNLYLGMSTKSFSRLVRINKSIQLLNESSNTLVSICEKLQGP